MNARSRLAFLLLIVSQAAHSVEEYVFQLYQVFEPTRVVIHLVSDDLPTGFALVNTAIVLFGLWCYVARIRPGKPSARVWAWAWIVLEMGNALGHGGVALARGGYFPGVVTAPLLLIVSTYLALAMRHDTRPSGEAV